MADEAPMRDWLSRICRFSDRWEYHLMESQAIRPNWQQDRELREKGFGLYKGGGGDAVKVGQIFRGQYWRAAGLITK
jgi:hypothetical protein